MLGTNLTYLQLLCPGKLSHCSGYRYEVVFS